MLPIIIPKENQPVTDIIFKYKGAIFGGYLRDLFANEAPKDMDVCISIREVDDFFVAIETLGFKGKETEEKDHYEYIHPHMLKMDVIISEFLPEDTWLGPLCYPDFDVNLLAYNGETLYNWTGGHTSIEEIIEAIRKKHARQLSKDIPPRRIEKIKTRGYGTTLLL